MKDNKDQGDSSQDSIQIPVGKYIRAIKHNPWIIVSIVLAVILVFMFFNRGSSSFSASEKEVSDSVLKFAQSQVGDVEVVSVERANGLYEVTLRYQGNTFPVYVTSDGKQLISQLVPLDGSYSANPGAGSQTVADVSVGDAPVIGNENAKVTVIEFSDFSCPFCAAASGDNPEMNSYMKQSNPNWEPIVTNLMKDYVNTGKARFAVKYSMGHSGGHPAQLVAWCLYDQNHDLYWKFYPKAFADQDNVENLDKMKDIAKSVGGDMSKLQTCLDSKKYESRFEAEKAEGVKAGASGTPAFFINGRLVSGAVPYSQVKAIIEEELAK